MDEHAEEVIRECLDRIGESLNRMEQHLSGIGYTIDKMVNGDLAKNLEEIKEMLVKENWKNMVIERIMYFLIGGSIGLAIHYYLGL